MQPAAEPEPKRVTPSEARAKLLHSLISQIKAPIKPSDRDQVDTMRAEFIHQVLSQDDVVRQD